jgi:hypothetical protein
MLAPAAPQRDGGVFSLDPLWQSYQSRVAGKSRTDRAVIMLIFGEI